MARYRMKPVEADAERFTFDHICGISPLPAGVVKESEGDAGSLAGAKISFFMDTPNGRFSVRDGDYIVTHTDGSRFVLPAERFEATFDPIEPGMALPRGKSSNFTGPTAETIRTG